MEREFIIILILFAIVLGGNAENIWAQDSGEPDTLHIEPWSADLIYPGGAGPYFVRVPIYVTTDLVTASDSISAFVIPLCYTSNNPSAYCSLSYWWNNLSLYPYTENIDQSIFRHLPSMYNPLVQNRMMSLSQDWEYWNYMMLDLDGTSHFWLTLMTTGPENKAWWEGYRVLLATMTFRLEEPMTICIDTCFWPPSSRLAFVNKWCDEYIPKGLDEGPRCFDFNPPDPIDCNRSFADPYLVACPLGDIPFRVYVRDSYGNPVPGYSNVWLDFSYCTGLTRCTAEGYWPIVYPNGPSDENGVLTFNVNAGGCDNYNQVQVKTGGCGLIQNRLRPVKTIDANGDLAVKLSDWHGIDVDPCNDFNCDGEVDYWDLDYFRNHIAHTCVQDPCLFLSHELTAIPDTLLPVSETHLVKLFIKNNSTQSCGGRVDFFWAGFGAGTTLQWFAGRDLPESLASGDTVSVEAYFVVPGPGSGYILSEFSTNCCDHTLDAIFNFTQRMCPPDSMVYVFPLYLATAPAYIETLDYMPDTLGWHWYLYQTGGIPDSVTIVTPDSSILGVTGGVALYFYDYFGNLLGNRTCEVRITLNSGDVTSDCEVNLGDAIALLNYLFRDGSAPVPLRSGDVNCNCIVDMGDAIYLLNYLFKSGATPVSSETCECEY